MGSPVKPVEPVGAFPLISVDRVGGEEVVQVGICVILSVQFEATAKATSNPPAISGDEIRLPSFM